MQEIIDWLIAIEKKASRLYATAARRAAVSGGAAFRLLDRLAEDEAQHAQYLELARESCRRAILADAAIRLDPQTVRRVEAPLVRIQRSLDQGGLKLEALIESVVQAEHSEWNDLFLFVVNVLKTCCPEMTPVAPQIQHHLRFIENGLAALDPTNDRIARIRALPPVWQENILIVDDQPSILELLRAVLSHEGRVHTAMNGAEGLKKISGHYFAVIISDVDMPVLNGWRFYRRLQKQFSGIGRRFIFITGNPASSEVLRIKQQELKLLYKPFSLADLRRVVYELMECNARDDCVAGAL